MNHPLLTQLQVLSQILNTHPQLATTREAVKALDKVTVSTRVAIDLLQCAAAGANPEAQELERLLDRAFGTDSTDKNAKALLKPLFSKFPPKSKGAMLADYLAVLARTTVKDGTTHAASLLIRKHLDAPRFDVSTTDEYELLKQIRQLGRMDLQQRKAAKVYLLENSELVVKLCEAASIPTTAGKSRKPVSNTTLVNKLIKHGERYAENASS